MDSALVGERDALREIQMERKELLQSVVQEVSTGHMTSDKALEVLSGELGQNLPIHTPPQMLQPPDLPGASDWPNVEIPQEFPCSGVKPQENPIVPSSPTEPPKTNDPDAEHITDLLEKCIVPGWFSPGWSVTWNEGKKMTFWKSVKYTLYQVISYFMIAFFGTMLFYIVDKKTDGFLGYCLGWLSYVFMWRSMLKGMLSSLIMGSILYSVYSASDSNVAKRQFLLRSLLYGAVSWVSGNLLDWTATFLNQDPNVGYLMIIISFLIVRNFGVTYHTYTILAHYRMKKPPMDMRIDLHKNTPKLHDDPVVFKCSVTNTNGFYSHTTTMYVSLELLSQCSTMAQHSLLSDDQTAAERISFMARSIGSINLHRYFWLGSRGQELVQNTAAFSYGLYQFRRQRLEEVPFWRPQ